MPVATQAFQVPVAGTKIFPWAGISSTGHLRVTVYNNGPNAIYVGPSGVTTATGMRIAPQTQLVFYDRMVNTSLYAICDTLQVTPADTRVLVEIGD